MENKRKIVYSTNKEGVDAFDKELKEKVKGYWYDPKEMKFLQDYKSGKLNINEMENKYYTPEINEFHVGFEYEHLKQDGVWHKQTTKSYTLIRDFDTFHGRDISLTLQACIDENFVRVKYLDFEDIESLGWNMTTGNLSFEYYFLRWNPEFSTIQIKNTITNQMVFEGIIKNKSELIKLMSQLNIH
jgi:hypothetical protein